MRHRLASGAAIALLWVLGSCGNEPRTRTIDGVASLAPEEIDFGKVGLGTTATRTISIRNRGRAPLQILDWTIEGLGQDMTVHLKGERAIREGRSVEVVLRFTPKELGPVERKLVLRTDDPERTEVAIPVRGDVILPHVVPVPEALDFGRVELGVREVRQVELRNPFEIEVEVRIAVRGDAQFSVSPTEAIRVGPLGSSVVEVAYQPDTIGRVVAMLALLPCPACDETGIAVQGTGIDRALAVAPEVVDFGYVPVERSAERNFTVTNVSSRPVEITSMELGGESENFSLAPFAGTLQPDAAVQVTVSFSPKLVVPERNVVRILSTSVRAPVVEVELRGAGGGPQIQVSPSALFFGTVPIGARGQLPVRITNAGTPPGAPPLEILDIRVENPAVAPFEPDRDLEADPVILDAGEQDEVLVGYEPLRVTGSMPDSAELVIVSNDALLPEIRIPMSGYATEIEPCSRLEVHPPVLDFGGLDPGKGATLSIEIRNPGTRTCILRNLRIAPGSDPVFRTREVQSFLVPGGGWFGWMVSFDPFAVGAGEGNYAGELELFAVNATEQQRYSVALRASSDAGCLVPDPNFLDFGTVPVGCGGRDGVVRFTNLCPLPLGVGPIELGLQSTEDEFEIVSAPATPFMLPSGASFDVFVHWNAQTRGLSTAPLRVGEETRLRPLMVPLLGELQRDGFTVDRFVQQRAGAADILIVVDNSSTMVEEQPRLRGAVHVLVEEGVRRGVDFHIGVTSTGMAPAPATPGCPGGADGGEAGRLVPVDGSRPRVVSAATPDPSGVLAENVVVGTCHELEQGMEAMRRALSEPLRSGENAGFLRSDAKLGVIFVSDEDDHSGFAVPEYLAFLRALKGEGGARVHAIVDFGDVCPEGAGRANRIIELVQGTLGQAESLCEADWTGAMSRIAADLYTFRTAFSLTATPDENGIVVIVDGAEADPSTYRYDPGSNSVSFAPASEPPPGSVIEVRYTARCGS